MLESFGHLHPILIHFPLALLFTGWALDLIQVWTKAPQVRSALQSASRWNLLIGGAALVPALITGWAAYQTVAHDAPSHAAMTLHRNLALATVAVFVLLGAIAWLRRETEWINRWPFRVGFLLAVALLLATGYRGGLLVYTYGLGVRSLPTQEGGDGHSHGDHPHAGPEPEGKPSQSTEAKESAGKPASPNPHPHDGKPHKH
jgi:uncharacterized membrane protein